MSFRRALGPFDATMVVVGGIIGSGIFINPYIVAQRLSSSGLVLAAWVAGGAIALSGAFAFAELGALFPKAGGEYIYLREAYHPGIAFLFGWASLLMIQGGGLAAVEIAFAQYTLRLVGGGRTPAARLAVAAIGLVAAAASQAAAAAARTMAAAAEALIPAAMSVSPSCTLDRALLAHTRTYYAMGTTGLCGERLARPHPPLPTPSRTILLQAASGAV